jgi:hypothetical protein
MIRLVARSLHLAQPLDLCVFGLFKIFDRKERKNKGMKGETRKDLPGITGVLREHDHFNGSVEFRASWLSLEF